MNNPLSSRQALQPLLDVEAAVRQFIDWQKTNAYADINDIKKALAPILEAHDRLINTYVDFAVQSYLASIEDAKEEECGK